MINEYYAKKYCKEDISLIENYEQAVNDNNQMWVCHHKEEIKVLPSGMTVIHSYKELKEKGLYYGRPANELIFLTKKEHQRLHFLNCSEETRRKFSEAHKGKPSWNKGKSSWNKGKSSWNKGKSLSEEHRRKISESQKGRTSPRKGVTLSAETRKKISEAMKGKKLKPFTEETRKKMSESQKGHTVTDETRKKMSEAKKGKPSHKKGVTLSDETRKKMSEAAKRRHAAQS